MTVSVEHIIKEISDKELTVPLLDETKNVQKIEIKEFQLLRKTKILYLPLTVGQTVEVYNKNTLEYTITKLFV